MIFLHDRANMARWCACLLFLLSLCLPATAQAWRWGSWRFGLKLQSTFEFDDNVRRIASSKPSSFKKPNNWSLIATEPVITSPLDPVEIVADGVSKWSLLLRTRHTSRHHIVRAWYGFGYQHYFWVSSEDHVSNRFGFLYYGRLHRRLLLGFELSGGDLRRFNAEREYSNVLALGRLMWLAPGGFRVSLAAGGGGFAYRNKEDFPGAHIDGFSDGMRYSYLGDQYRLQVQKSWGRAFRVSFAYGLSRLHFDFINKRDKDGGVTPADEARTDLLHGFQLNARYLRGFLLKLSYRFELMQSASVGESFYGHVAEMLFSYSLPWELLLVLQGQMQFRTYTDGLSPNHNKYPVGQLPGEDENLASSATIRISRRITKRLRVHLRYRVYSNLFSGQNAEYFRQLISAGFALQF